MADSEAKKYEDTQRFIDMWDLVDDLIDYGLPKEFAPFAGAFSDEFICTELMMGLFFEETIFQNIAQFKGGPAGGFGQVERGARSLVIHYFNNESPDGKQKLGEPRF